MPLIEEDADLVSVVPSSACVRRAAPESGQDRLEGTAAYWGSAVRCSCAATGVQAASRLVATACVSFLATDLGRV